MVLIQTKLNPMDANSRHSQGLMYHTLSLVCSPTLCMLWSCRHCMVLIMFKQW